MFEAHVSHLLKKYLGDYVQGLSAEALRISVWKGDVVLRDLQLKAEALNSLRLPVVVKAGFIGTITLKVPWKSLGKEPVIVIIDRVFILAHPAPDGQTITAEDREKLFEAKLRQIEEAESTILEAKDRKCKLENTSDANSWLGSLIATIIGNLKISITNVHIRYEDSITNSGHPFCVGITLAKLAAVTMDENGNETFDTSGALDKLRKSVQLQRLAMYHDPDCEPWKVHKCWMDLNPREWIEIFEDGINDPGPNNSLVSKWAIHRKFLISPINGVLKYHRLGNQERKDPNVPFEKASLVLSDVSITILEAQYYDGIKLLEVISRYKMHVDVSHLRPKVSASKNAHAWWHYAVQAVLQQKKMCYRLSWERIQSLCHLRRRYVQLYANFLQQISLADNAEMRKIERDLDSKIILLWRLLAHAKVETVKIKEIARQKSHGKKSWWSFGWGASSKESVASMHSPGADLFEEQRLTKEEWRAINKLLSYQTEEELSWPLGKDMAKMMQYLVNVSIETAAARIINIDQTEILCGKFEQLQVSARLYPRSIKCDVTLKLWGLSSPEGSLVKSVSNEKKVNALAASFVYSPSHEDVDWWLSANIAPCHVTVLMGSYDRLLELVRRSNAISPVVASETATALQSKLERVTKRAQEQFQLVLEEQSRFSLDIDFDAPKVRVPLLSNGSLDSCGHLLLDFGHFTVQTKEGAHDDQKQSFYSRFYISGRDITAFFLGGPLSDADGVSAPLNFDCPSPSLPLTDGVNGVSSLIDRFGALLIIEQIKVPHPSYPPTRVSVQVPNLAIHFSPSRYSKILDLLNIIYRTTKGSDTEANGHVQTSNSPWYPSDLATDARLLVWTGIGYSTAEWRPCFLILSSLHLYALDSEASPTYRRCISMVGRQVFEVSPTNVGGSLFSIAVSYRRLNVQKALESSSTMIIEFGDDELKTTWMKALVQATYKASAPPAMDMLMEPAKGTEEPDVPRADSYGNADLVVNINLVTVKLMIYGKVEEEEMQRLDETLIIELLASGGKVNIVNWGGDLTVNTKLHCLQIKDEFQGRLSGATQYLARSVLQKSYDDVVHACDIPDASCAQVVDEEDVFRDALPDFAATSDQSFHLQRNAEIPSLVVFPSEAVDSACNRGEDKVKMKSLHGEMFYEAQDDTISDFVVVTFLTRHPGSLIYEGIDVQMCILMSKLEFYCNRATLVALTKFSLDLSLLNSGGSRSTSNASTSGSTQPEERNEANEHSYVRGLLGHGKDRVVFYLKMDVNSVCIYLNKEDGSQLAMLVQENFLLDLKMHPSSISIEGTLGNLRLCDMSLGMDHCWGWLCDLRNSGVESLIKFNFQSYNVGEDDYDGCDYSLTVRLSAVRIIFLYRFVQEIMAYFWQLATPQTEEAIKLVDKVRGIEWLIQKYEIDGATALKLDLLLDTPIIIVPQNSRSKDFMQLDLGRLIVRNEFTWHGCKDEDPSAVHLDVLHAEVQGINVAVGIDGILGRPMVKEGQGLHIHVRRSLRDVFRKVPTLSLDFKVGLLHSIMSDKEYNVIVNCFYMNISEIPNLPPSFRGRTSVPKETIRMLADKVNVNSQVLLSRTVTLMTVEVSYALMELYNGFDKGSPLAHISLEGLWVSYRTTSHWETDIYVTIPKFSVVDIRPDAKQEMCLMLGSSSDIFRQSPYRASGLSCAHSFSLSCDDLSKSVPAYMADEDPPNLTMLLMDYKLRSNSQSFVFRIQQPRVLVVLDFLLAVGEFFVPALGAITGRDEIMHSHNDPITQSGHILLSTPLCQQTEDIVYLSPHRKLIADGADVDEFVYDGCGRTICLTDEFDLNGNSMVSVHPIIIIGRGKTLRFKNVKFENGALLPKGTYLNNDSSYTVCKEDGVLVTYLDASDESSLQHLHDDSMKITTAAVATPNNSSPVNCFTFEAQVISPEFTFYDSTNISMNDSLQCEKFLRAKMDINFMYASKEKDTWVRALVKDLSIEAGSGLVVLDPIEVSGGYTSVNDKTNIFVQCTDICIHLPLSVISLALHLQNDAFAALQIGNDNFLSPCTNFRQIWASEKGNSSGLNLCIWRPQPPSNYAILGDCVTFGPVPPSQAVMAVSNTYGRVRKAAGFNLVGSLSGICGAEDCNNNSNDERGCSLWMPIPPPGYKAMGCVAHIGGKPPPNHIVYCIRADLVTSATFLDCVLYISPSPSFLTGFSIWLVENAVGSFYAHSTVGCPPKCLIFDFHEIVRRNMYKAIPCMNDLPVSLSMVDGKRLHDKTTGSNSNSLDVLQSITKFSGYYMSTPNFERIWWDRGSEGRRPISIWRPIPHPGFSILGDCIAEGFEPPSPGLVFRRDKSGISAKPLQFTKVAHIAGKGIEEAFFWFPVAPPGYASLGCMVSRVDQCPSVECICCLRIDLVNQAAILDKPISCFVSSKASQSWSIWRVDNQANTFLARSDQTKPSSRLAYCIGDCVRPKANENISGEMKLKCFSLTILDDSCGMMTPFFDATVTNLNLATYGRPEAMSAVLISSIAASTFNAQLEAWEPLIEPFDGIFKYESYKVNLHLPNNTGKRIRIAATSVMNVNISAANIEAFAGVLSSWRNQTQFREKVLEDGMEDRSLLDSHDATNSALEETDPHNVVIENKLGSDIYMKIWGNNSEDYKSIRAGESTLAWFPPPSFSDRFNVAFVVHEIHRFVAVHVFESRGLAVIDDGNQHDFFCALRLVPSNQTSDQQKLFPQSARTRCIRPIVAGPGKSSEYVVRWNELFIFEVPQKGPANLEVEVTNLGSKAGKGEVIGVFSVPISDGTSVMNPKFSHISSRRHDLPDFASYSLRKKGHVASDGDVQSCGFVLVSTSYFERKAHGLTPKDLSVKASDSDVGFWVALAPEGPWTSFRRLLPLGSTPKEFNGDFFAFDVAMKKGKKHVTFRSLATVVNDTNLDLEICICPLALVDDVSSISTLDTNKNSAVTEEIFENQRYQPVSGWTSKWHGSSRNDPGPWSSRDYSQSSKDFFEPALPTGWKWTSDWTIDKSLFVDTEGWAYGSDFQTLKWPPLSSRMCRKSALDFVRRRRWIRIREFISETTSKISRVILPIIKPGSSLVLPWKSMISSEPLCLQVRPFIEGCHATYFWTRMITNDPTFVRGNNVHDAEGLAFFSRSSTSQFGPVCGFMLDQLEKKDMLLFTTRCNNKKEAFWFSIGTDASILQTELNSPVYDWRISLNPPIKLENKLPYHGEYSVWEKDDGNRIKLQNGIVLPGCTAFIYSADVRKPIYLSWMVEGGWVSEKDSVLILDPALGHVSSFWLVNQKKNRKLRVNVEHDLGGTVSASKTVRIFVPYWISNDSGLPLSCQIVEVEPSENVENDSSSLSRVVKSAKFALKAQSSFMDLRRSGSQRNLQLLEDIEELGSSPLMLSPQDYANHGNILSFASRNGPFLSPRIGIAVALSLSNRYSPGISLMELEKDHVSVNAFSPSGSYYKLSAFMNMKSDRTKVIHFRPHTVVINRLGQSVALKQYGTQADDWFHPDNPPKPFQWRSTSRNELLEMRLDGFKWSTPFSVENEGVMCIILKSDIDGCVMYVLVEVRKGSKISRYQVIICPASSSSPYRIENQSTFLPILFRQVNGTDDSWRPLQINSAVSFFWDDLGRQLLLEVLIDGVGSIETVKCNIDEPSEPQPLHFSCSSGALCVCVVKEGSLNVVKFTDWRPSNNVLPVTPRRFRHMSQLSMVSHNESPSDSAFEFHVIIELAELGLSVIDHTPEEIIYLSVQNLLLTYSNEVRYSRFKLRVAGIQLDNQLPLTPMPVLFRHQKSSDELDHVLKLTVTVQSDGSSEFCVYPYIGVQGPQGTSFLVKIHEPILWRLHEMFQKVKLSNFVVDQNATFPVDPVIQIGLLNISEFRFKVSVTMSPALRPRGVLGFWASLMTALGNMENMPIRINHRFLKGISVRKSSIYNVAFSSIQKDLLSRPLHLLSGVDILGNASSALGNMSKGVAALSMDKKFIQSRQRQGGKGTVEDIGDVIREGGGALAKGLFRGVTGILTKPLEGAKSAGVEGFVQGVGKGIIGAAAQPVSGVLDLLSKTTEGANAVRMKITSAIASEEQLLRRRLPRVISGDNVLRPYDEYKAQGQIILQLAESGTIFGQADLFKVRGKFALSDSYEDHFILPKGMVVVITHRRVLLLQILAQGKFNPSRDPCSVLWDVSWSDLYTMELRHGRKDDPRSPPSLLVLYLDRTVGTKENVRVIEGLQESHQASEIYASIEQTMNTFGPNHFKEMKKKKVKKPYSPSGATGSESGLKEVLGVWTGQETMLAVPISSTFGTLGAAEIQSQPELGKKH